MLLKRQFVLLIFSFWYSSAVFSQARLTSKAGVYNNYFLEDSRLRHQRYELALKQASKITDELSTIIEGRFRGDAALYDHAAAPRRNYDQKVRDDELAEAEMRQAYFDYLTEGFALKIGIQQIDWAESLSPNTNDILTPLDLRHGGFGDANQIIEPVLCFSVNHPFIGGTLEWLVIPQPKPHRLPKAENGYGYYEFLQKIAGGKTITVIEEKIPDDGKGSEGGIRYLTNFSGLELTLLGFRGHQRTAVLLYIPISPSEFEIRQSYPAVNTFGVTMTNSWDEVVMRFLTYYEPERHPLLSFASYDSAGSLKKDSDYDRRLRLGIGFDYVVSKHLKIYTEQFETQTERITDDEDIASKKKATYDYSASIRMTNESFQNIKLAVDDTVVAPNLGHIFSFKLAWQISDYELALGTRLIRSYEETSALEPIKGVSHIFLSIDQYNSLNAYQQSAYE